MEEKTIAIRVPPELHQQLVLLAQLAGHPLAEEIRAAVDTHIARRSQEVDLAGEVEKALAELDQDTARRRKALQALQGAPKGGETAKAGRKTGKGEDA